MLLNYFKIAFRNLIKNKLFGVLNIAGLALGLAVFILIMLWVQNERSYNGFHKDSKRIGAIMVNLGLPGQKVETFPACPPPLAAALKKDMAAVELASRVSWGDVRLLTYGEKYFSEYGLYVDPDFLRIFSFPLLKGNTAKALREPHTILISSKLAKKYFGDADPIGKMINVEKTQNYRVEGVLSEIPANSSLQFDFLMPMKDYIDWAMGGKEDWSNNNIKTYVKLKPGTDASLFNASLKDFAKKYTDKQQYVQLFMWNMEDWYLRFDFKEGKYAGGGRITYVRLFIAIAFFILLLACINFMNLSTARATNRAKEVGVRKAIGAGKRSLIAQFIGESLFMSLCAGIIALVLVALVLPVFNHFLNRQIQVDFTDPFNTLIFLLIVGLTGILAGSYPAFVLSAFRPVKVLKSIRDQSPGHSVWVRKTLVVAQFAISVMLIIGTIVVYNQVNYIKNKKLGYNRDNLVWFANNISSEKSETAIQEMLKVPGVLNVTRASMTFTSPNNRGSEVTWPGKKPGQNIFFSFITGDQDIVQTMGIEMKEGRSFSRQYATDTGTYLLNEEAVKQMGLEDPVGKPLETHGGKGTIVGVVKDFHFESMHSPIAPAIIECRPEWTWLYYIRMDGKNTTQTLAGLENVYKQMAPGYVFDYNFQDKEYERLYKSEQQIGTLVSWFAFFAIFISCLGLLGLTIFTVERRKKEIGIRKVLGASVGNIVTLVSRQFVILVLLAVLIAAAPSWYFMNSWLQNYTYRVDVSGWIFLGAGVLTLIVALITVSAQAIRAAITNPVHSLRTE